MKFVISTPLLTKALQRIQGVVDHKKTMPILAHALIKSRGDDKVTIAGTDLEIGLTADYEAEVKKKGGMTLEAKGLFDIVRALPEDKVTLTQDAQQWVTVECGRVKYRIAGMDAGTFPSMPSPEDEVAFTAINAAQLRTLIERSIYGASTDDTRYNLTGVYVEPRAEKPGLRLVATDGHRLALVEHDLEDLHLKEGVIVPRKGLLEARKLLGDAADATARLGFVENNAVLELDGVTLTMRLVDGRFPDWAQVVPEDTNRFAKVDRVALLGALKRVSLVSDRNLGVRCDFEPACDEGPAGLTLTVSNPDRGDASERIEIEYAGEELTIGFNNRYVMDVLGALPDDVVEIAMVDELSAAIVRGTKTTDGRGVVMPMRV